MALTSSANDMRSDDSNNSNNDDNDAASATTVSCAMTRADEDALLAVYGAWDVVCDAAALRQFTAAAPSHFVSDYGDTNVFLTHAVDDENNNNNNNSDDVAASTTHDNDDDDDGDGEDNDAVTRRVLLRTLPLESLLVRRTKLLTADTPHTLLTHVGDVLSQLRASRTTCEHDNNNNGSDGDDGAADDCDALLRTAHALLAEADGVAGTDNDDNNSNNNSDKDGGDATHDDWMLPLADDDDDDDVAHEAALLCEAREHVARWALLQPRVAAADAQAAAEADDDDNNDNNNNDNNVDNSSDDHDVSAVTIVADTRHDDDADDDAPSRTLHALPTLFAFDAAPSREEAALLRAWDDAVQRRRDVHAQTLQQHQQQQQLSHVDTVAAVVATTPSDAAQQQQQHDGEHHAVRTRATRSRTLRALYADPCGHTHASDSSDAHDKRDNDDDRDVDSNNDDDVTTTLRLLDDAVVSRRDARVQSRAEARYARVLGGLARRRRDAQRLWRRRADVGLAPLRTVVQCVDELLPPPAHELQLRRAQPPRDDDDDDDGGRNDNSSSSRDDADHDEGSAMTARAHDTHAPPRDAHDVASPRADTTHRDTDDVVTAAIVRAAARARFRAQMEYRESAALRREDAYALACACAREAQAQRLRTQLRDAAEACARDCDTHYADVCACEADARAVLWRAAVASAHAARQACARRLGDEHAHGASVIVDDECDARTRLCAAAAHARQSTLQSAYTDFVTAQRRRMHATCSDALASGAAATMTAADASRQMWWSSSWWPSRETNDDDNDDDDDDDDGACWRAHGRGALWRLCVLADEQRRHVAWLRHGNAATTTTAMSAVRASLAAAHDELSRTTAAAADKYVNDTTDDRATRVVDDVLAAAAARDVAATSSSSSCLDAARLWQHPSLQLLRHALHDDGDSSDRDAPLHEQQQQRRRQLQRALPLYARVLSFAFDGIAHIGNGDDNDDAAAVTTCARIGAWTHELDLSSNALTALHTHALLRCFPALRRLRVCDNALVHVHVHVGSSSSNNNSSKTSAAATMAPGATARSRASLSSSLSSARPRHVAAARANAHAERVCIAELDVSCNALCALDDVALWLTHSLQHLRACSNRLTSLAPLALCRRLVRVDVARNALRRLDGVAALPLLRELNVCHNDVTHLYSSSDDKHNDTLAVLPPLLQKLYASSNPLTTLQLCPASRQRPPTSSRTSSLLSPSPRLFVLTQLFVNDAQLRELSAAAMRSMPLLTVLHAEGNALTSLRGLQYCTRLAVLNVSHNRLATTRSLAPLAACRALVELDVRGNAVLQQQPQRQQQEQQEQHVTSSSLSAWLRRMLPCLRELNNEPVQRAADDGNNDDTRMRPCVLCAQARTRRACIDAATAVAVLSRSPLPSPSRAYKVALAAVAHDACLHDVQTHLDVHAIALTRSVYAAEAAASDVIATRTASTPSAPREGDGGSGGVCAVPRSNSAVLLAAAAALQRSRVVHDGERALLRAAVDGVTTMLRRHHGTQHDTLTATTTCNNNNNNNTNNTNNKRDGTTDKAASAAADDAACGVYCNVHVVHAAYAQRAHAHAQSCARQRIATWLLCCVQRRRAQHELRARRDAVAAAQRARRDAAARRIQPLWRGALLRARLRRILYTTHDGTRRVDDVIDDDDGVVPVSEADLFGDDSAARALAAMGDADVRDVGGLRPLLHKVMATRAALPPFAVTSTSDDKGSDDTNTDNGGDARDTTSAMHDDDDEHEHTRGNAEPPSSSSPSSRHGGGGGGVDDAWRTLHGAALAARLAKQKRRMAHVHAQHVRDEFTRDPLHAKKLMTSRDAARRGGGTHK